MSETRRSCDCDCQAQLIAELRARIAELEEAGRLALLWIPDEDMIERAEPREQVRRIRAVLTIDDGGT